MRSIRQRLLQNLFIGLALIASGTGILVYHHVREELDELYNTHMKQVATFMAREWRHVDVASLNITSVIPPAKTQWEEEDYLIQIWHRDGELLIQELPAPADIRVPLFPQQGFFLQSIQGESWRGFRADSANLIVQIAQPEYARNVAINETSVQLLMPLVLQVPLLVLVGWISVRRGLKPLEALSAAIAQRRPEALAPINNSDQPLELRSLVDTLNDLLARLNDALHQQRHFVADAAHELRTPIAALQLQLDLLARVTNNDEREQAIKKLRAGLQRVTHLSQQLLSIARAESTSLDIDQTSVDLLSVVETVVERNLPFAHARELDLGVARLESNSIRCVRRDIETVLDNLIGNAIRYTPPHGRIDIAIYSDSGRAVLEVSDSGSGVPINERTRIFDRFYRVLKESSGGDMIEGSGLGLAIVKAICDRYGAEIIVSDGESGQGARFTVYWPLQK